MISLPYLASDPHASVSGAVVQNKLSAKAASIVNTAVGVNRAGIAWGSTDAFERRNRALDNTHSPHSNSNSLAVLIIAIDKPTDTAAMQMAISLKLGVLVGKMDAVGSWKVAALSMILSAFQTGKPGPANAGPTALRAVC